MNCPKCEFPVDEWDDMKGTNVVSRDACGWIQTTHAPSPVTPEMLAFISSIDHLHRFPIAARSENPKRTENHNPHFKSLKKQRNFERYQSQFSHGTKFVSRGRSTN